MKRPLPFNVHLVSYNVPSDKPIFHLRLHHIYEKSDNVELGKPVMINIQDIFNDLNIKVSTFVKIGDKRAIIIRK